MNETTIQQKLNSLTTFTEINPETVKRLGEVLLGLDDWGLLRINPLTFAQQHEFKPMELIDLFIHGAKIGLFDFQWNTLCPGCGGVEYRYDSINEVESKGFHCTFCRWQQAADLDDRLEVTFTINPTVRKLTLNPFENTENYSRYFFSNNFQYGPGQSSFLFAAMQHIYAIQPDETLEISFNNTAELEHSLMSLMLHKLVSVKNLDETTTEPQLIDIDILPHGFSTQKVSARLGPVTLRVRNLRLSVTDIVLLGENVTTYKSINDNPPKILPMFTGKMLLNNQTFRDLFRLQTLRDDLTLNMKSLTLLFTDLKGSTDLYDATGDAFAYNLIQEHFKILSKAVRLHSGAIIKTMGDAIMAAFSTPQEGVQAAIAMMEGMNFFNERLKGEGHELGLKVGLHEGSALVVNASDRLDYFGQTVNIAARVQGLAKADEIWITAPIYEANQITDSLNTAGYQLEQHSVMLKGVSQAATVYRLYR